MALKPSTVRVRVTEALHQAREEHRRAEAAHRDEPNEQTRHALERALRELRALERRVVQVDSGDV